MIMINYKVNDYILIRLIVQFVLLINGLYRLAAINSDGQFMFTALLLIELYWLYLL